MAGTLGSIVDLAAHQPRAINTRQLASVHELANKGIEHLMSAETMVDEAFKLVTLQRTATHSGLEFQARFTTDAVGLFAAAEGAADGAHTLLVEARRHLDALAAADPELYRASSSAIADASRSAERLKAASADYHDVARVAVTDDTSTYLVSFADGGSLRPYYTELTAGDFDVKAVRHETSVPNGRRFGIFPRTTTEITQTARYEPQSERLAVNIAKSLDQDLASERRLNALDESVASGRALGELFRGSAMTTITREAELERRALRST